MATLIVRSIRDFLDDPDAHRWKDPIIISLINEAMLDIASETDIFKTHDTIPLVENQEMYTLPDKVLKLDQVYINNKELSFCSYKKIVDKTEKGVPTSVIIDQTDIDTIRLHPIPGFPEHYESTYIGQGFGVYDHTTPEYKGLYFGNPNATGDTSGHEVSMLTFYYSYIPEFITDIDSELTIPTRYNKLVSHYVCGRLLRSDKDTNSRELGMEEFKLYQVEIEKIKKDVASSFTTNQERYTIDYRGL